MTFSRPVDRAYDPLVPDAPFSIEEWPGVAVVLPLGRNSIFEQDTKIVQGPDHERNLRLLLVAGKGLTNTPVTNDHVTTLEGQCRVLGVVPLNPNGKTPILYHLKVTLVS